MPSTSLTSEYVNKIQRSPYHLRATYYKHINIHTLRFHVLTEISSKPRSSTERTHPVRCNVTRDFLSIHKLETFRWITIPMTTATTSTMTTTTTTTDIHQLNLIMEILGTPNEEFMAKISSESVSNNSVSIFSSRLVSRYAWKITCIL